MFVCRNLKIYDDVPKAIISLLKHRHNIQEPVFLTVIDDSYNFDRNLLSATFLKRYPLIGKLDYGTCSDSFGFVVNKNYFILICHIHIDNGF